MIAVNKKSVDNMILQWLSCHVTKLGILLTFTIVLSTFVMISGAAFQDQDQINHKEAVEKLTTLKVLEGRENGMFDPQAQVTRAEMCKIITVILNGGYDPYLKPLIPPTYSDIKDHWAEGYIEYCNALGIIAGKGDGSFQPNAAVTETEAAKMMLAAMGYKEPFTGEGWAIRVHVIGCQIELYNLLEAFDPSKPISRDDVAQLIFNGMTTSMVKYDGELRSDTGKSILDVYFKGQKS